MNGYLYTPIMSFNDGFIENDDKHKILVHMAEQIVDDFGLEGLSDLDYKSRQLDVYLALLAKLPEWED